MALTAAPSASPRGVEHAQRLGLVGADFSEVEGVGLERTEIRDGLGQRYAGPHWKLEDVLGVDRLGGLAHQELQQPDGVVAVGGVGRDAAAADVDVGAAAVLVGPEQRDLGRRLALFLRAVAHAGVVVRVGDSDIALPRSDGADLVAVAALGIARQVGDDPRGPRFGRFGAVMDDQRRQQRLVVDAARGPDTDRTAPLGVGEVFVGG